MTHELNTGGDRGYLRIATEEAFATREQIDGYLRLVREGKADQGVTSLWGFYAQSPSERADADHRAAARSRRRAGSPTWTRPASTSPSCR